MFPSASESTQVALPGLGTFNSSLKLQSLLASIYVGLCRNSAPVDAHETCKFGIFGQGRRDVSKIVKS